MSEEQLSKDKASKGKKNKASGTAAMLNQKKAAATEKDAQESESVSESEGISGDERPTGIHRTVYPWRLGRSLRLPAWV